MFRKGFLLCGFCSLLLLSCEEHDMGVVDTGVNNESIANKDTIIVPHYGTIDIIIPQQVASVVNVEGYTASSFRCRVDMTKEPPLSGGGISSEWIAIDYKEDYPLWEPDVNYYNSGQMYHYSETKETYYNDNRDKGPVNGAYDGLNNRFLHYDWPIDKTIKHRGKVKIDIPGYLQATYNAEIRFQGQSTQMWYPKKNFRITLYKDESFTKKEKIKIGDLIKLSGYNLKAYYPDPSRLVEPIIYAMIHKVYRTYDYQERYPWNKSNPPFNGATGTIKGFPVKLTVNGEFYGVEFFGEKKDKNNYMLDGSDASGLFVQGVGYQPNFWDIYTSSRFEDQMIDEDDKDTPWVAGGTTTQSNDEALSSFYNYFNNYLERETAEKHFNKNAWIDYMILLQVFHMFDNMWNNIILFSDTDKTKFTPFFYDLDMSLYEAYDKPEIDVFSIAGDTYYNKETFKGLWLKLKDVWWEDMVSRYKYLRQEVLRMDIINQTVFDIKNGINEYDFENEILKWQNASDDSLTKVLNLIESRLIFCDNYFVVE